MSASADFSVLLERLRPECERIIAQYEERRSALLPLIHLFQEHQGYASREAMHATAEMLGVTPAIVESTVSFYTLFYRRPVGKYLLQVCRGLSCMINGADDVMAYMREKLGVGHLQTTADGLFSYEEVECLAACDRATCMQVNLEFVYDLTPAMIDDMLVAMRAGTYAVKPLVQTAAPNATWMPKQDGEVANGGKAPGATGVNAPNNAGGVGDPTGIIMLDRLVNKTLSYKDRTRERVIANPRAIETAIVEEEQSHAGH